MIFPSTPAAPDSAENPLDLGPDLPIAVFTSTEPWHPERIGALALYCSDGRWGEAFDEFCHKCLQIPRYDRWAVPGGPAWLAADGASRDLTRPAREQLDFLVEVHKLERIVLITHYGCAAYGHRLQCPAPECLSVQLEDVQTAARTLRDWYPEMRVEGYLAMRRGRGLSFHELGVWGERGR
jgi:hypothetical protein